MGENPFQSLGLVVRVWLEPEEVEGAWRQQSAGLHPDSSAGDREEFAQLNAARAELADPARRVKRVLGLIWPERSLGLAGLEPDLEPLWQEIQAWLPGARELAGRWQAAQSALAKALLSPAQMQALGELQRLLAAVGDALGEAENRARELDQRLVAGECGGELAEELERLRARFGWLGKWRAQLQEVAGELW